MAAPGEARRGGGWGSGRPRGPYLDGVKREWIRVQIGTRSVSPWGNLESFVWVGRRAELLKRDGEVIQIPQVVAQRIRRGAPIGA